MSETESESATAAAYAAELKTTTLAAVRREWDKIKAMTLEELEALTGRSKLGCNIVDHYFFAERLITVGKKLINFLDFVENIEYYKTKKYIQTLLTFCEKNNRYVDSMLKRYYYIYGLCFGRVNAFKVTNALAIYKRYNPTRVIDPFAGFGGRMVASIMANIEYRGYDLNVYMESSYAELLKDFTCDDGTISVSFCDSSTIDYDELAKTYPYDMVFTSPPYKNIEIYRCSKKQTPAWWNEFYYRVFSRTWNGLAPGGYFVININDQVYQESLVSLFGECREKVLLTKCKKNVYDEYIYIWVKPDTVVL
jgi:DNA modification methylase